MTEYLVFRLRENPENADFWEYVDQTTARSARAAIREFAGEGSYVAVPERSWRPVIVKVETKTALKFS